MPGKIEKLEVLVKSGHLVCLAVLLCASYAFAQEAVSHVSHVVPVQTASHVLSAQRSFIAPEVSARSQERPLNLPSTVPANSWKLLATLPGTIIHDMAFVTNTTGFAVAEAGQVWKTTNGGKTWTEVLNLGYPYYFYGVAILNAKSIVVSGFIDSSTEQQGILRWTEDGGTTWSSDIPLPTTALQRVRFANANDGLVFDLSGGTAQYTTDGGATSSDWTSVTANPSGAWFGLQFSLLPNLHARASGVNFCTSLNAGAAWTCGTSVDSVFDGPVLFQGDLQGVVGGGEIAPAVEGWVHITTNGGKTWSARTLDGPWPIRQLVFINTKDGWAAGGNIYSGVGGIYYTSDGGSTWSVDVTTNAEMDACDKKQLKTGHQVWCAGYDASYNGYIYTAVTTQ
jgi:photosystem II stability/assembly factor-like uncharacterized protein